MDRKLARKLETNEPFRLQVSKLAKDYLQLGQNALHYWLDEFDAAHDILMAYAPLSRKDLDMLEKGHPKRFVLPMTATQVTTMATFIAQSLFGDEAPHRVQGRGPEDEVPAEHMNQLLRWNAEQQPTYLLGYLWIQDALTFNRGILYNSWHPNFQLGVEMQPVVDEDGSIYFRSKKVRKPVGGFCKMHLISPYDWYCDPGLPLHKLQEMRFCGHRTMVSWQEMFRRSKLPVDDPAHVSPRAVDLLRARRKGGKGGQTGVGTINPATNTAPQKNSTISRTSYERSKALSPQALGVANKEDPGLLEVHEVWVRLVPDDHDLWNEKDSTIVQILLANSDVVLAVNESTYAHDQFPYSAAEGRPSGHYQFSPGWAMLIKPLQDYVDYLKNRHQEAISRTLGNIFVAKTDKVNLDDFLNPDKEGIIIPVLPEASGEKMDDIIKQVPMQDMTRNFQDEMKDFIAFSETVTGANAPMQGQIDGRGTATEFAGTQQMSAGRLSSISRLISVQGLVPQTKQFVSNFQQFLEEEMMLRFVSKPETPNAFAGVEALKVNQDVIQGQFDFIAHDGTLPGTDSRKVAAMAKLLESAEMFPHFFEPSPGNLNGRSILLAMAKSAGVNVERFQYGQETAQQAAPQPPPPGGGASATLPDLPLPPGPPVAPPGPGPGRPEINSATGIPSIEPPQIRPANA